MFDIYSFPLNIMQDMANSGLMYLCQVAGDVKNALTQPFQVRWSLCLSLPCS